MKLVGRNFVGGYYLTDPLTPNILRGIRYNQYTVCGIVGDKALTYIPFTPDELDDTKGDHQEMFDLSGVGADEIAADLLPLLSSETPDLSRFAPSAVERVTASMLEGMNIFDACMTHVARLLPEYCGATFNECVEFRPELLVISTDSDGNEFANIQRCSLE